MGYGLDFKVSRVDSPSGSLLASVSAELRYRSTERGPEVDLKCDSYPWIGQIHAGGNFGFRASIHMMVDDTGRFPVGGFEYIADCKSFEDALEAIESCYDPRNDNLVGSSRR